MDDQRNEKPSPASERAAEKVRRVADESRKQSILRILLICFVILSYPTLVHAQEAPCVTQANEKKLQGEARDSYLKACEQQAKIGCETVADRNNLTETEKASFVAKCVKSTAGK